MDDVESFTLRTNYIEPIQVQKFYVKNIITIVPNQYDIQFLVSLIQIEIENVEFGLTWTFVEYNKKRNRDYFKLKSFVNSRIVQVLLPVTVIGV